MPRDQAHGGFGKFHALRIMVYDFWHRSDPSLRVAPVLTLASMSVLYRSIDLNQAAHFVPNMM